MKITFIIIVISTLLISNSCQSNIQDNGNDMNKLQVELTDLAIKNAKQYNVQLDLSNESIKDVEEILSIIHDEYSKTKNDIETNNLALEYTAYIITVIENNFEKGKWERDDPVFGEDTYTFYWRGGAYYIYSWCLKRIVEGEEDNIWIKYKLSILENTNTK